MTTDEEFKNAVQMLQALMVRIDNLLAHFENRDQEVEKRVGRLEEWRKWDGQ